MNVASFVDVDGAEGITLDNIKLIGSTGDSSDQIQVLNLGGEVTTTYIWLTEDGAGMPDGWYDFETWESVGETKLPNGTGIYIYAANDVKIQSAGQVLVGVQTIPLAAGYNSVGNSTNVNLTLDDIKLVGAVGDSSDQIQVLNLDGEVEVTYIWLTEGGAGMPDGWYDFDTWESVGSVTVDAGKGLYIYAATDISLTLPAQI